MLPARHRLREQTDFTSVVRGAGASRVGGRLIVVHANRSDARANLPARVGFAVSKAVGNAVVRNRTKRRLRAIAAGRLSGLPNGLDLVVRASPPAALADFDQLRQAFDRQLDRVSSP